MWYTIIITSSSSTLPLIGGNFVAKAQNVTLADMLDMWMNEELAPSKRSNGTARSYINTANRVKQHTIGNRKLKTITADHLQKFFDSLSSPQKLSDGTMSKGLSSGSLNVYAAVMRGAFRFAVFPKQLITFNPMQYVWLEVIMMVMRCLLMTMICQQKIQL